jgi:uncharacterized membrane protein
MNRRAMRACGLRELGTGIGILATPRPAGWLWGRVGGDTLDLALLGAALAASDTEKQRVAGAAAAVLGVTALDIWCAEQLSEAAAAEVREEGLPPHTLGSRVQHGHVFVRQVITINKPAEELYRFWRDFENLPKVMQHLQSVRNTGERRSHWVAKGPFGRTVEWDSEVTDERPNERIAWRSLPGSEVEHEGMVAFERAPGGRGAVVRVELHYRPPGGVLGATVAKLFGREPGQEINADLRAFKAMMETGEKLRSDATAKGMGAGQPPAEWPPRR